MEAHHSGMNYEGPAEGAFMLNLRYASVLAFSAFAAVLTGCGGSGGGSNPVTQPCNPGIALQLANPVPAQTGVSTSIGQVILVTSGSFTPYAQWQTIIVGSDGSQYSGGSLNPVSGTTLPHPYPSDFYYSSAIQNPLSVGVTYTVQLNNFTSTCTPPFSNSLLSFST
jgi:hypothetical protein